MYLHGICPTCHEQNNPAGSETTAEVRGHVPEPFKPQFLPCMASRSEIQSAPTPNKWHMIYTKLM